MNSERAEQPKARNAYSAVAGTLDKGQAWIGISAPLPTSCTQC